MIKKRSRKWLLSGILFILILSLSSWIISLSINNEEELLASAAEKKDEEELVVSKPEKNNEEELVVSELEKKDEEKPVVSEPEKKDEEKPVVSEPEEKDEEKPIVSEPEENNEEIAIPQITSEEAIEVIRKAYLNFLYIFFRDVDPSQSIGDGMYCRPLDKQLSYDAILAALKGYYTERFIERGNIATKALIVHEGNPYVLLLQGSYDCNSNFEVISFSSTEDTAELRVKLITEYDSLESEATLKLVEGKWKVESGDIFPMVP